MRWILIHKEILGGQITSISSKTSPAQDQLQIAVGIRDKVIIFSVENQRGTNPGNLKVETCKIFLSLCLTTICSCFSMTFLLLIS